MTLLLYNSGIFFAGDFLLNSDKRVEVNIEAEHSFRIMKSNGVNIGSS